MNTAWISIAIALLKLAHSLIGWLHSRNLMQAGEDKVIASTALAILHETQTGKELRAYIDNMEEAEALALWDRMLKNE